MSEWHGEIHPDDLPPEALKEFHRLAHEITVRESMNYLGGKYVADDTPGVRAKARGRLMEPPA